MKYMFKTTKSITDTFFTVFIRRGDRWAHLGRLDMRHSEFDDFVAALELGHAEVIVEDGTDE